LAQDPKIQVSEIVRILANKGIDVKPSLVYIVRKKMRIKRRRQGRAKAEQAVSNGDPVVTIRKVKSLAHEVGGINKLKTLVDLMAE
jgi:hypothetical protein